MKPWPGPGMNEPLSSTHGARRRPSRELIAQRLRHAVEVRRPAQRERVDVVVEEAQHILRVLRVHRRLLVEILERHQRRTVIVGFVVR